MFEERRKIRQMAKEEDEEEAGEEGEERGKALEESIQVEVEVLWGKVVVAERKPTGTNTVKP